MIASRIMIVVLVVAFAAISVFLSIRPRTSLSASPHIGDHTVSTPTNPGKPARPVKSAKPARPAKSAKSLASQVPSLVASRQDRVGTMAQNWPRAPDYRDPFNALTADRQNQGAQAYPVFNPNDEYSGLPRHGAFELVDGYCGACHSLQIVMQQRHPREQWDRLLVWMTEKQNMPPIDPEDRHQLLDYLEENFGR